MSIDPLAEKYYSISPYAYCANNPIKFIDPDGMAYTATNESQMNDLMEYLNNGGDLSLYSFNGWKQTEEDDPVTPWTVGMEWLTGKGPRHRTFTNGDPFLEMLKGHEHIENLRRIILKMLADAAINNMFEGRKKPLEFNTTNNRYDYGLSGLQGVGKYIKDYSTLLTLGQTGNLAVTYLGSYSLHWSISSIDEKNRSATVQFVVNNNSSMQSATRPPLIGYSDWWKNSVGRFVNSFFSSGPMSATSQTFLWTETLNY